MNIFSEDFSQPRLGWLGSQIVDPSRIALQTTISRIPGKPSLQINVQPGDCPLSGLATERNEYLQMLNTQDDDVDGNTLPEHYALSLYLPSGWQDTVGSPAYTQPWCTPLQLHAPDNYKLSPAFQLDLCVKPGRFTLQTRGRDVVAPVEANIDLGLHVYDQWVDFVFRMKWAANSTGHASVWRRDNAIGDLMQVADVTTPTLFSHNAIALPHYWKSGCYRNPASFTTTFYRSRIVRATTFEEAGYLAFWS